MLFLILKNEEHPNGIVEGPNIPDAVQFARIVKKLGKKLDAIGMSDIRFVAPDASTDRLFSDCLSTMIKDPYLMGKLAHWGVHQYGSSAQNYMNIVVNPSNPNHSYWVTETAGIGNMLGQLADSAQAYIFWDGFDCVYQHARRNGYGDNPPNDWVFWEGPDAGKPLIAYDSATGDWKPRKQFYQFAQLYEFVKPGAVRIGSTCDGNNMVIRAFLNPDNQLVIVGRNAGKNPVHLAGIMDNLPEIQQLKLLYTTAAENCHAGKDIKITGGQWSATLPADCIFTLNGSPDPKLKNTKIIRPEPDDWFAGDMHVHRNCGADRPILPESEFINRMKTNNLAVISVLADMGDAEVQNSRLDLPKVDGMDAPQSEPGRIVHYDAEWHFDPEGVTFDHKAIGGHLVLLGLQEAHQIWDESPYKIVQWAKAQGALAGFCHMEYLNDSIPKELSCCIPLDYPVETALGTIDFLAEDVWLNDAAIHAYYRLLNCGFRPGWAAGTDYPCNENRPLGSLMTYVQVKNPPLTYRKWIDGIREGRTVVTTDGHAEFLDLKVDGDKGPGDDIRVKQGGNIPVVVTWTADSVMTGRMEVVCNGKVVASQTATALPGKPVILKATVHCENSSWICARRMDDTGHRSHTAAVFLTVNNRPVRASAADAEYFVQWINNLLAKTAPGGPWNGYFTQDLQGVQARYQQARTLFEKIEKEAKDTP